MWDATSDVTSSSDDDDDWWNSLAGLVEVPDGMRFDIVGDARRLPRADCPPIAVTRDRQAFQRAECRNVTRNRPCEVGHVVLCEWCAHHGCNCDLGHPPVSPDNDIPGGQLPGPAELEYWRRYPNFPIWEGEPADAEDFRTGVNFDVITSAQTTHRDQGQALADGTAGVLDNSLQMRCLEVPTRPGVQNMAIE